MNIEINQTDIEKKWQKKWSDSDIYKSDLEDINNKYYCLTMFSYPSGDKLHIGHWYNYGPVDTFARFKRMNGFNVFQPQGFDAFGLPAENFAIKHGVHPRESTNKNISTMKQQLNSIGGMFNWENEIRTCDKEYYKWNQWLFIQLYNNNLAYQKEAMVNWDPIDQTVLANEQVLSDGTSDRSGAKVIQKPLKQWFFKITDYAEKLLDFKNIDWPQKTISMQKNWIGKSKGASINFHVSNLDLKIEVFTTRPDTLFGATYLVLSPENPIVEKIVTNKCLDGVVHYQKLSNEQNEIQRLDLTKEKTGVFTGSFAINPVNGDKIPIWIADYVLMSYGTGAIMAVPGHDERDNEFAHKFNLPIKYVVNSNKNSIEEGPYFEKGFCINSEFLNNLSTDKAIKKIIFWLEENKVGKGYTNYRLRDWLISRQRYWGTPIPIVYDPNGKPHVIPEQYLPWELPNDVEYKPKGTSPLGSSKELIERTEKIFGKGWKPEIDTMDTFVCSSWYYLRYLDPHNTKKPFADDILDWMPVDLYVGGAEHATMHLLYSRFITKALKDLNYISFDEPFKKLIHQGTITKDGAKMSKSKGNTVSPDKFIEKYGSDTFRIYLMFMGPYEDGGDWSDKGITGISRFLSKVVKIVSALDKNYTPDDKTMHLVHKTIKFVTNDLNHFKFNTAISKLMELSNHLYKYKKSNEFIVKHLLLMLAPFAPHLCEELHEKSFNLNDSIFNQNWPKYKEELTISNDVTIAVQVNGKLRGSIKCKTNESKEEVLIMAKSLDNVNKFLMEGSLLKEIYIPNKIVNLVVKK